MKYWRRKQQVMQLMLSKRALKAQAMQRRKR
jgi:hypothetical protein